MEYQDVKDWLDRLINIKNEAKKAEYFNKNVQAIMYISDEIHIYVGIESIAKIMGVKLHSVEWEYEKIKYYFKYSGVKFFQIGNSKDCRERSGIYESVRD